MTDHSRHAIKPRPRRLWLGSVTGGVALALAVGWLIHVTLPDASEVVSIGEATPITTLVRRAGRPVHALVRPVDAAHLEAVFEGLAYDIDAVRRGAARVPRVYVTALPADLAAVVPTKRRKALFLGSVLPLVLIANEELRGLRGRVERLGLQSREGRMLDPEDADWLSRVSRAFGLVPEGDIEGLLFRVDEVPVSLALAQSIEESGWGTSRFARQGNALFGQRTWSKAAAGVVPAQRGANRTFRVRSYMNLMDAVRAYMHNLNTHPAYRELRAARAKLRAAGLDVDGDSLANTLDRYSERGMAYVEQLRDLIRGNGLHALERARLFAQPIAREEAG